jgi:hypothetical protein
VTMMMTAGRQRMMLRSRAHLFYIVIFVCMAY